MCRRISASSISLLARSRTAYRCPALSVSRSCTLMFPLFGETFLFIFGLKVHCSLTFVFNSRRFASIFRQCFAREFASWSMRSRRFTFFGTRTFVYGRLKCALLASLKLYFTLNLTSILLREKGLPRGQFVFFVLMFWLFSFRSLSFCSRSATWDRGGDAATILLFEGIDDGDRLLFCFGVVPYCCFRRTSSFARRFPSLWPAFRPPTSSFVRGAGA